MIDSHQLRAYDSGDITQTYTHANAILYALGVGVGADPLDQRQLPYIYEKNASALPTMASVLSMPGFWLRERKDIGADWVKLVHGAESVRLLRPLPAEGTLVGRTRVKGVVDKGEGKGAIVLVEKSLTDAATGQAIAVCERQLFLRGDGGFSATQGAGDAAPTAPQPVPATPPEQTIDMPTRADQAALYRLSGDLNPLHIDPEIAARAGFPRPILHGLATFGIACHALLSRHAGYNAKRLKAMQVRFASPVFPGETVRVETWGTGTDIAFQARVMERNLIVLSHGRAEIAD